MTCLVVLEAWLDLADSDKEAFCHHGSRAFAAYGYRMERIEE